MNKSICKIQDRNYRKNYIKNIQIIIHRNYIIIILLKILTYYFLIAQKYISFTIIHI